MGAGDKGGAQSFMGGGSASAVSFAASQSDFLFKEPTIGFV